MWCKFKPDSGIVKVVCFQQGEMGMLKGQKVEKNHYHFIFLEEFGLYLINPKSVVNFRAGRRPSFSRKSSGFHASEIFLPSKYRSKSPEVDGSRLG
jgi:hypothetical protein